MNKEVKEIEDALVVLRTLNVGWTTVNRIQNSMWERGVAFFGSNHCCVAYYDETQEVLTVN